MKILGVDIGTSSVKVAELEVSSKGFSVSAFFEMPLSLDPQKDQGLEVLEALRQLSGRYDPGNTRWVVAVPQYLVSIHNKRFPFRERQKILKSLAFELEDEIPFDIDETVFDAKPIEFVGPMTDTLTVATPKEAIRTVLEIAENGGIDPEVVTVEGLALGNVFANWEEPLRELPLGAISEGTTTAPQPARLILQLGHQRSTLLVIREGVLIAVRSFLWGGDDIAQALSKTYSIQIFEALKILREKAFILLNPSGATREQVTLSNTISNSVDTLVADLRLTLLELRTRFRIEFLGMELTGGLANMQNLTPYLTSSLSVPTNVARPLSQFKNLKIELTPRIEAVATNAIGLAIEGLKRPSQMPINLRRDEFAREDAALKAMWATWRVPVQVAFASFLILCVYAVLRENFAARLVEAAEQHVSEMGTKVANLKGASATETGVKNYVNKQKKVIRDHEALEQAGHMTHAFDVLTRLTGKLPVELPPKKGLGIDVSHLLIENEDVVIEGRAQANSIGLVRRALEGIAKPKSLTAVPSTRVASGDGQSFAFKFKVERRKE